MSLKRTVFEIFDL